MNDVVDGVWGASSHFLDRRPRDTFLRHVLDEAALRAVHLVEMLPHPEKHLGLTVQTYVVEGLEPKTLRMELHAADLFGSCCHAGLGFRK